MKQVDIGLLGAHFRKRFLEIIMSEPTNCKKLFDKECEYYSSDRSDIFPFVPQNIKKTLEFGCGQGNFSVLLKKQYSVEAWAVELHEESAQLAAQKLDRVLCMDAMRSLESLPDGYFDCIFFLDLLEHLADPYSLLDKCRDKLSEKGVVIASIPNIRYYRVFSDYVFHGRWEYRRHGIMDIGHLRFFTYHSIKKMFQTIGYSMRTLQGVHPTSSKTYFLLNALFLNRLWDLKYKHFIVVAEKGN